MKKAFFLVKRSYYFYLFIIFLLIIFIARYFWSLEINYFLNQQEKILIQQGYQPYFKQSYSNPWRILPTKTLVNPILQTKNKQQIIQKWQAKKLVISYSFLHPFRISIKIAGNQQLCVNFDSIHCLPIYGKPLYIFIPINNSKKLSFSAANIFMDLSSWSPIHFIQIKHLKGDMKRTDYTSAPFFLQTINLKAQHFSFSFHTKKKISLEKIQTGLALIANLNNFTHTMAYKLLVQKMTGRWSPLLFNINGKFNLLPPSYSPMGELTMYIEGIQQFLEENIQFLHCCNALKNQPDSLHYPNHLTIPLLIRNDKIYFNNISLPYHQFFEFYKR